MDIGWKWKQNKWNRQRAYEHSTFAKNKSFHPISNAEQLHIITKFRLDLEFFVCFCLFRATLLPHKIKMRTENHKYKWYFNLIQIISISVSHYRLSFSFFFHCTSVPIRCVASKFRTFPFCLRDIFATLKKQYVIFVKVCNWVIYETMMNCLLWTLWGDGNLCEWIKMNGIPEIIF